MLNQQTYAYSAGLMKLLVDPLVFSHLKLEGFFASKSVATIEEDAESGSLPLQKFKEIILITEHYRALRWLPLDSI